jgi:hypothetical protein
VNACGKKMNDESLIVGSDCGHVSGHLNENEFLVLLFHSHRLEGRVIGFADGLDESQIPAMAHDDQSSRGSVLGGRHDDDNSGTASVRSQASRRVCMEDHASLKKKACLIHDGDHAQVSTSWGGWGLRVEGFGFALSCLIRMVNATGLQHV